MRIPFNKPFLVGKELDYIKQSIAFGKISGNGFFTKKCQGFFEKRYGYRKCLMTTSCTDALEMCALLIDIAPKDEVIMPSYTFVSTANAFALRGAKIVFADSSKNDPNIDPNKVEDLITENTKAIVVVHYAGVACNMDKLMDIAHRNNIILIEDAAQAIDSYYKDRPLGSIGHLATFSFHETKNIISGEGGMLVINDEKYLKRAEIIWEKGTNRAAFFRGETNKYEWLDIGSSFLPSELISAFLWAQLEKIEGIQKKRKHIWDFYYSELMFLQQKGKLKLPVVPKYGSNNGHLFYVLCNSGLERQDLMAFLKNSGIYAVSHYLGLHRSKYYANEADDRILANCDRYENTLLRLPFFFTITEGEQIEVIKAVKSFYCANEQ